MLISDYIFEIFFHYHIVGGKSPIFKFFIFPSIGENNRKLEYILLYKLDFHE